MAKIVVCAFLAAFAFTHYASGPDASVSKVVASTTKMMVASLFMPSIESKTY